jgi:O-succinylbenzoate synthase
VGAVAAAVAAGAPLVKCKIAPDWCAAPLSAVRAAFPDLELAADANGSFGVADGRRAMDVAAELGLAYLEQPLPPKADGALADLLDGTAVPVALDESVAGPADIERLAASGAAIVNVKAARLGGLAAALDTAEAADRAGLACFVGGMLELGVGRAVAVTLAAGVGGPWPTDVGPSARYVAEDVATEVVATRPGTVRVPRGPGIGVDVHPERLGEVALARTVVRR